MELNGMCSFVVGYFHASMFLRFMMMFCSSFLLLLSNIAQFVIPVSCF